MTEMQKKALIDFLKDRKKLDVPGNALLIYHHDRELFRHFAGADEQTLFRIFSMTKVVTVTAALQLMELGRFTMDDPLSMYLPEYAHMTVWDETTQTARPAKNTIRIRDLFCMSAGLTYGGNGSETARSITAIGKALDNSHPGIPYSTQEFCRAIAAAPLKFEPGTHWEYSLCHDVLGALIEVLSGQTLGEYMKEHIFDPLGMQHTFFRCPPELQSHLAPCDAMKEEQPRFMPGARYESGGGGLLSTVDDYMRFALALTRGGTSADGARILSRKTIDLLRMDQLDETQKADVNWRYLTGYSYGLGVRTLVSPAKAGIPGSVGEFGWCGVLGTWVLMDPTEQLTVVYMHQRMPNLEEYVQTHLRAMIYGLLD